MYIYTLYLILFVSSCAYAPILRCNQSITPQDGCPFNYEVNYPVIFQDPVIFQVQENIEEQCREYVLGQSVSIHDSIEILRNSLALLDETSSSRQQRTNRFQQPARNLVRILTGQAILYPSSPQPQSSGRSTSEADEDYTPPKSQRAERFRFKDSSARIILGMVDKNKTTKSIQAMYPKFRRDKIQELRQQVAGNSTVANYESISNFTRQRVLDARRDHHVVRGFIIRYWAMEHARSIGARNFKASASWLNLFKKRNRFGSRKIGKRTSRAKERNREKIESSKFAFLDYFERQRIRFSDRLIFNFDQSGFEYELTSDRTISLIGERDTYVSDDQANKATHSYTITPVISRDGRTSGKLLICMKEDKGEFGPRVAEKVKELEELFGNIDVISSTSGKMTVKLMKEWVERGLLPPILELAEENPPPAQNEPQEPQPGCSWQEVQVECANSTQQGCRQLRPLCPDTPLPTALVLADSWGGNINSDVQAILTSKGIQFMQIPPGTTDDLQPCDVEIFRQWKYLARRLTMQAHYDGFIGALTSRAGVFNMQSLIHNQFSAPSYQDLIRYSWRHVDRNFSRDELSTSEFRTIDLQFSFKPGSKCDRSDCDAFAFIKCSHCGHLLCAKHFFERKCFHEPNDEDGDEIFFEDEDFDADLIG